MKGTAIRYTKDNRHQKKEKKKKSIQVSYSTPTTVYQATTDDKVSVQWRSAAAPQQRCSICQPRLVNTRSVITEALRD